MLRRALSVSGLVLVLAATGRLAAEPPSGDPRHEVVRAFVEAFNRHDPEAMVALVDEAVEWLAIDGTQLGLEARGKDALRSSMQRYFASCPTCRSSIASIETLNSRVAVLEVASWVVRGEKRAQRALAVYEFRDERIRRVYYFPSE